MYGNIQIIHLFQGKMKWPCYQCQEEHHVDVTCKDTHKNKMFTFLQN